MSTHSSIVRTLRVSTLNVCEVHSCLHMCGVSHDPGDQKETYIVMSRPHRLGIMQWWPMCLSVCLSVPWLTLSQEQNCIGSWNLSARKLMTDVTRDFIYRSKGQRSSSLGLWNSKFWHPLLPPRNTDKMITITVLRKVMLIVLNCNASHKIQTSVLFIKGICCNYNNFIYEVKNNNCHDVNTGHQCIVDVLI